MTVLALMSQVWDWHYALLGLQPVGCLLRANRLRAGAHG